MDHRDPASRDDATCGVCREHVPAGRRRLVASRDDLAFVELRCEVCRSTTLGFVFRPEGAQSAESGLLRGTAPVSAADVTDMRRRLARWHGDLRSLLDRGAPTHGVGG